MFIFVSETEIKLKTCIVQNNVSSERLRGKSSNGFIFLKAKAHLRNTVFLQ